MSWKRLSAAVVDLDQLESNMKSFDYAKEQAVAALKRGEDVLWVTATHDEAVKVFNSMLDTLDSAEVWEQELRFKNKTATFRVMCVENVYFFGSFENVKLYVFNAQVVDRAFGKDYSETFYKTHEWRDTPVIVYHPSR